MSNNEVEIKLDEKKFKKLMDLVHLGCSVVSSVGLKLDSDYLKVMDNVLSKAAGIKGLKKYIIEAGGMAVPSKELENDNEKALEKYEEHILLEKLVDEFTMRDLRKEIGFFGALKLKGEEMDEEYEKRAEQYREEFRRRGIERLVVKE